MHCPDTDKVSNKKVTQKTVRQETTVLSINAGRHWPRRRRLVCIVVVILARALVDSSERPKLILDVSMVNYSLYDKKGMSMTER